MSLTADDKRTILDLLSRSAYAYDQRQLDMLESCFAADASFSIQIKDADLMGPFEGRDAIMTLYRNSMDAQTDVRRHIVSNAFFESDGDQPVVVSNLTLFATEAATARLLATGVYRDVLCRLDGRWVIKKRHLDLDSPY